MNGHSGTRILYQLAHLYGVQTVYYDVFRRRQQASAEALMAMLRSLGAPVATLQDVPSAWRERRQSLWQRPLEPVIVNWDKAPLTIAVRLPSSTADACLSCYLRLETGEWRHWEWCGADLPVLEAVEIEGIKYVAKQLSFPEALPWGYHRLTLRLPGRDEETLIIVAPLKAYVPLKKKENRIWGVFLPLYALHTRKSWGSGDFSDLEALITWIAGMGGQSVATLPVLATFLNDICEPSPYLPVSRQLWNEFYLDITRIPELQDCPSARTLMASSSFKEETKDLLNAPLVDYHRQMLLKRQVLEELCRCFFARASDKREALQQFAEANPVVEDYARFRATGEKLRVPWHSWPQPLRDGILREGDYDEKNRRYHLYVQWLAHQQIQALSEKAKAKGVRLYLDLPLGVHSDGYDVWRQRNAFMLDASAGAPPDPVFAEGQNWKFPPLHPDKIREQGYQYFITYLRHHLRHAGILRFDHVMSLHRLFCIPNGLETSQGLYVRYRAEELYAILSLESHRNSAIIVGEDLGTVPPEVRQDMGRHNLQRMYVVHYELASRPQAPFHPIRRNSVASLNTHDMATFASFWQGLDIEKRLELGLLDETKAQKESGNRSLIEEALATFLNDQGWIEGHVADIPAILKGCLAFLSASQARVVLVNLEDLWLETQPQNIPSTVEEYPNWRRKSRYSFEAFSGMPEVIDTLLMVEQLRKQGGIK